jgi:hypothetical protein
VVVVAGAHPSCSALCLVSMTAHASQLQVWWPTIIDACLMLQLIAAPVSVIGLQLRGYVVCAAAGCQRTLS